MNKKLKVIVGAGSDVNKVAICEFLKKFGYEITDVVTNGKECAESVIKHLPDVVITDTCFNDMDSCGMLDLLFANGYSGDSVFAVMSSVAGGCVIENAISRGVDIFTLIPFDSEYIDSRIRRAWARKHGEIVDDKSRQFDLMDYVCRLMHEVGVPASIRGYDYIRDSIMLALSDRDILRSITKELYPSIAKSHSTTSSRVERAIRHAVEVAWSRGDVDVLNGIFGYTVKSSKGKPTNGEFISMLTERVRLDLRVG